METHNSNLVVGDVVRIFEGMSIPCDGFVIQASELSSDESAMTGETDPIKKGTMEQCMQVRDKLQEEGESNMQKTHAVPSPIMLSGTKVLTGEGRFLVIVVGKDSCLGKIR